MCVFTDCSLFATIFGAVDGTRKAQPDGCPPSQCEPAFRVTFNVAGAPTPEVSAQDSCCCFCSEVAGVDGCCFDLIENVLKLSLFVVGCCYRQDINTNQPSALASA